MIIDPSTYHVPDQVKKTKPVPVEVEKPSIVDRYSSLDDCDSCDIFFIDERIRSLLRSRRENLPSMNASLTDMKWISKNSRDPIERMAAETRIRSIRREIIDIESSFDLSLYEVRISDKLSEYRKMQTKKLPSFMSVPVAKSSQEDIELNHRRSQLATDIYRIAKSYINLDKFVPVDSSSAVCDACHGSNYVLKENSEAVCECRAIVNLLDEAPTFKDAERVNMSSRYTYTCRGHFIEAMNRFEGKQNSVIPRSIIKSLKKEMKLHGLTKKTVTKDLIYMFLTEKKMSKYYADINLIYFLITGVSPPDITLYRDELLELFDQVEMAYAEVKDDDRLNSLNVNWKLYKLLQILDFPCKKDDFFCLKTPNKQGEHEGVWYLLISFLKDKYPNATTSYGKKRWRHIRTI